MNRSTQFLNYITITVNTLFILLLVTSSNTMAQTIHTKDVVNFWNAYDQIHQTNSHEKQLDIINTIYLNPGSDGLKKLCQTMNYSDSTFVRSIVTYPKFWNSLRVKTESLQQENLNIQKHVKTLKSLYPDLQPSNLYMCIGLGSAGGRPIGKDLVIGLELALGDSSINTTELRSQDKRDFYKSAQSNGLEFIAVHEYIHTQQKKSSSNYVLKQAIREGSCDFMAELVIGRPLTINYIKYGYANYQKSFDLLRKDLVNPNLNNWFYNYDVSTIKDLGYFMGYVISKKYYENSLDPSQAIKEIIELDYADDEAVFSFLNKSGVFDESLDYAGELIKFKSDCPTIESITPIGEDKVIASTTKKIGIAFLSR
ncbi:hypothetical protein [Sphingobacterium yanglingense]|uniref:Uncharacterized protein n=1 Tax=Sphingobacterium yanglingense TaxID=1437280 RepID=A0A4R6WP25_9SPHI|nr:hypothetical protein [Sphingobacterium yanglingense]TDQ80155.1 hypothetical protein CLV99_1610 [Sphingobacterium yanglingense]